MERDDVEGCNHGTSCLPPPFVVSLNVYIFGSMEKVLDGKNTPSISSCRASFTSQLA